MEQIDFLKNTVSYASKCHYGDWAGLQRIKVDLIFLYKCTDAGAPFSQKNLPNTAARSFYEQLFFPNSCN